MNRSAQREIVLHLGLPKTGTTTLQRHYFPKLKGYRNLGKILDNYEELFELKFITEFIVSLYFAPEEYLSVVFKNFDRELKDLEKKRYGQLDKEQPIILSYEPFTTFLFNPNYFGYGGFWTADINLLFSRLAEFGTKWNYYIKPLLTIREPKAFIHSFYAQIYYKLNENKHIGRFKKYLNEILESNEMDRFGIALLFNDKLEKTAAKYFVSEDIYILKYEEIFKDKDKFQKRFERIFNQRIGDFKLDSVENSRSVDKNIKFGSIKPGWLKSERFMLH